MAKGTNCTFHEERRCQDKLSQSQTNVTIFDGGPFARCQSLKEQQSSRPRRYALWHFGEATLRWLLQMMNSILKKQKFPKLWRKSKVIAILKPGKDSTLPKSYRPISLLCHTYKLFERMILNRLNPLIETMIIDQQAGFRPGKSTTGQLLNLTQHIEDGYEQSVVTGTVFVDLSAAYDTISHKLLLNKIYRMTSDIKFTDLIGNMLSNRRYFVELNGQKSRWRNQKNGLPQGSVLITCALQHLHK